MTNSIRRVVVVDDQAGDRNHLRSLLENFGSRYELIGEFDSVVKGIEGIEHLRPDLLFLDVMLNPGTGFDVLGGLSGYKPSVIFTTSFQEFALRALRLSAVDYLLKPYGISDLSEALERFESRKASTENDEIVNQLLINSRALPGEERITLSVSGGLVFLPVNDIVKLDSHNVHTVVHVNGGKSYITSQPLKDFESILEQSGFLRVHQSHIVNLRCVREFRKGNDQLLVLHDETKVPVSRRKKDEIADALKRMSL